MTDPYTVTVSRDTAEAIILALGIAAGRGEHGELAYWLQIANEFNTNNPDWNQFDVEAFPKDPK